MSLKSARVASERPCDPGRANHVWEPGGLSPEQAQWDWVGKVYSRDRVLKLMESFMNWVYRESGRR